MANEANKTKELTTMQKALVSKRLDALRADFPVQALRVLMEDGSEWIVGEFPQQQPQPHPTASRSKKGHTRKRVADGKRVGELARLTWPFVALLMQFPNEVMKMRMSDFPGEDDPCRIMSSITAQAGTLLGKGKVRTWREYDSNGDFFIMAEHKPEGMPNRRRTKEEIAKARAQQPQVNGYFGKAS